MKSSFAIASHARLETESFAARRLDGVSTEASRGFRESAGCGRFRCLLRSTRGRVAGGQPTQRLVWLRLAHLSSRGAGDCGATRGRGPPAFSSSPSPRPPRDRGRAGVGGACEGDGRAVPPDCPPSGVIFFPPRNASDAFFVLLLFASQAPTMRRQTLAQAQEAREMKRRQAETFTASLQSCVALSVPPSLTSPRAVAAPTVGSARGGLFLASGLLGRVSAL